VLTRYEIQNFFRKSENQPKFLNFDTRSDISNSKPIVNREIATSRSFEETSINKVAGLEGSPSFETIVSTIQVLQSSGAFPNLSGLGIEVGSGIGFLSAAILKLDTKNEIIGIIAVEASLPFVETGINLTKEQILKEDAIRLLPCYGSFDSLDVENDSVDFIVQIEAFHHADTLGPAISEAFRILRKGGYLISLDRSWPNKTAPESLLELLDHEYSKEWLIEKGFPSDRPFSRRDNGEHEYIDSQWKDAFISAGFTMKEFLGIHPNIRMWHLVKRLIGILKLQELFSLKIPSRAGVFRALIFKKYPKICRKFRGQLIVNHPRPLTISVWQK